MSVLLTLPEEDASGLKYAVDKGKERLAFRESVWRFYYARSNESITEKDIKFGVLTRTNSSMN